MTGPLVAVDDLTKHFPIRRGVVRRRVGAVRAVDGVTFDITRGETLGLVGESGSGKSTLGRAILRAVEPTSGRVVVDDCEVTALDRRRLRRARRRMQMVFQDPYASLNPRMTVGAAILEALDVNDVGPRAGRRDRVRELLTLVGLDPTFATRYPHEFSGGQRQRIGIARALAPQPSFLIADEAISALDVSIQAQIVNLLDDLKHQLGLTYLFIAHDVSMVRYLSDRIAVMYLGRIVELGDAEDVYARAQHPYTRALISAVPVPDPDREARRQRIVLTGDVGDPANPPSGCRFRTRCPAATEVCANDLPPLRVLPGAATSHLVACHHAEALQPPLGAA